MSATPTGNIIEIGLPNISDNSNISEYEQAQKSLLHVDIVAMKPKPLYNLKLFNLVRDHNYPNTLRIYFESNNSNISESFHNNVDGHFLKSLVNKGVKMREMMQMFDIKQGKGIIGGAINDLGSVVGKVAGSNVENFFESYLTGVQFDIPKIWQGSTASIGYTIKTKLLVNNPADTNEVIDRFVNPLQNILKLSLPIAISNRKTQAKVSQLNAKNSITNTNKYDAGAGTGYIWPPFISAISPGLFYVPEGIITDVTVDKGPNDSLSIAGTPMIIEVTIKFESIRNVVTQHESGEGTDAGLKLNLNSYLGNIEQSTQYAASPKQTSNKTGSSTPIKSTTSSLPAKNTTSTTASSTNTATTASTSAESLPPVMNFKQYAEI